MPVAPPAAPPPERGLRLAALGLVTAVVATVLSDRSWLAADEGVQFTDAAYHFSRVVSLRDGLDGQQALDASFDGQRYGALVYVIAAALSVVTGLEPARLLLGLSVLLRPILLSGGFLLGWELGRDGRRAATALLTAVTLALLPGAINYGRVLVLDLPLTAAVCWAAAFALRALRRRGDARSDRGALAGFGAAATVAMLIKLNALAFLLGPAWVLVRGRASGWRPSPRLLVGGLTAAVLVVGGALASSSGAAIARTVSEATWPGALVFGYLPQGALGQFVPDWLASVGAHGWEALYFTLLQTLTPPWAALALAAAVWFFGRRHGCADPLGHAQRDLAFWWLVIPAGAVILLLRGLYDERYVLPLLPLVAGLIAVAVLDLPRVWLRAGGAIGLTGVGVVLSAMVHIGALPAARPLACLTVPGLGLSARVDAIWLCATYPEYRFMDRPTTPTREPWGQYWVADAIAPLAAAKGAPLRAVFLDETYPVFYRTFQWNLLSRRLLRHQDMLLVTECWNEEWMRSVFETTAEVEATIARADVVIMRYGAPDDPDDDALRGRRCVVFWSQQEWFEVVGDLPLADGTSIRIYGKRALLPR